MVDVGVGDDYMYNHILSQQYLGFNNGDLNCVNGSINIHTLSQLNYSSSLKDMDGGVKYGDVSGGNIYINSHTLYEYNCLILLADLNNCDDIEINDHLNNGDLSCVICF